MLLREGAIPHLDGTLQGAGLVIVRFHGANAIEMYGLARYLADSC